MLEASAPADSRLGWSDILTVVLGRGLYKCQPRVQLTEEADFMGGGLETAEICPDVVVILHTGPLYPGLDLDRVKAYKNPAEHGLGHPVLADSPLCGWTKQCPEVLSAL